MPDPPRIRVVPLIVVSVFALFALGGRMWIALIASILAASLAWRMASRVGGRAAVITAAGAGMFPLVVAAWGEPAAILTFAGLVVLVGGALVLRGRPDGAATSFGQLMVVALTTGFLLSYAGLIASLSAGRALIWSFFLMVAAAFVSFDLVQARFSSGTRVVPWVASVVAAVVLALVSKVFLPDPFGTLTLFVLGLTVGLSVCLGSVAEDSFSRDPFPAQVWGRMGPLLFAAPAFFYVFRLYLT